MDPFERNVKFVSLELYTHTCFITLTCAKSQYIDVFNSGAKECHQMSTARQETGSGNQRPLVDNITNAKDVEDSWQNARSISK